MNQPAVTDLENRHFGYGKVPYRGLAKNTERFALLLGLSNLVTAQRGLAS